MLVGTEAKVPDGLARVLGTPQEQGVGASRLLKGELIEGDGLTTGGKDTGAGRGGEAEGGDADLGYHVQAVVVGDGADHHDRLLLVVALVDVGGDARERQGRAVHARHEQPTKHHLVEGRVGTACKKMPSALDIAKDRSREGVGEGNSRLRKRYNFTSSLR